MSEKERQWYLHDRVVAMEVWAALGAHDGVEVG